MKTQRQVRSRPTNLSRRLLCQPHSPSPHFDLSQPISTYLHMVQPISTWLGSRPTNLSRRLLCQPYSPSPHFHLSQPIYTYLHMVQPLSTWLGSRPTKLSRRLLCKPHSPTFQPIQTCSGLLRPGQETDPPSYPGGSCVSPIHLQHILTYL